MRARLFLIAFFVWGCCAASAEESNQAKDCIITAASRLPKIPGIEIKTSRTEPVPAELGGPLKNAMFSALVHIDTRAAGQDATFNFVCAIGKNTPIVVTPYR